MMKVDRPRIIGTTVAFQNQWVELVAKAVRLGDGREETFYCLRQAPYVAVLARLEDGRIPIVRQYRPCVEDHTWELPAGTVDTSETPADAARRELREEAGLEVIELEYLGNCYPDTGRLDVESHCFLARVRRGSCEASETGIECRHVTPEELRDMILAGEFRHQLHLSLFTLVSARTGAPRV
jgi:ADP-ribose pyrophosphatase